MTKPRDCFRDFGIIPYGLSAPRGRVRSYLPRGHILGQYVATGLMSCLGLGMAVLFALILPVPANVLAAATALGGFGFLVYLATRHDYAWVELDGQILRAKHLYTRRIIERSIDEIDNLLTLVLQIRTVQTRIVESWLGRVRGIMIRFHDERTPLGIVRADPAMKDAKRLIEAVIFRMSEIGEVEAEIIDFAGKPLIRRIYWKDAD